MLTGDFALLSHTCHWIWAINKIDFKEFDFFISILWHACRQQECTECHCCYTNKPHVSCQHETHSSFNLHCLGRASANLLRLVRLSAPSWFRMLGSISVSCFVSAWPVIVKVLAARDAWTFGLLKWMTVPWLVNMFTCKKKKIQYLKHFSRIFQFNKKSKFHEDLLIIYRCYLPENRF